MLKPWHELQADSSERLEDIPWLAPRAKIGPGSNPITVDANGQFESKVLFQQGEHPTWKSWDLTNLTQMWVNTPSSNNGVILWATNEDVNSYDLRFYSSENETKPPELMVIWSNQPKTVYFLKDHLGSIRATVLDSVGAPVVAYDDYDPWGYILSGRTKKRTWSDSQAVAKNKFTGKEWDDEYSVNWLHFPYRSYDPEIARWMVRDPLEMKYPSLSPYVYAADNPANVIDIAGDSTFVVANDNGTYTVTGGNLSGAEDDTGIYTRDADGNLVLVGQSITTHSFFDDKGRAVVGAVLDPTSYEGALFVLGEVIGGDPTLLGYMFTAWGGQEYDFKERGIKEANVSDVERLQHHYRGSAVPFMDGAPMLGSAKDFGNIGAGIVAGRKGLSWEAARLGFDALESIQEMEIKKEGTPTQKAQKVGYTIGVRLRKVD